MRTAAGRRVFLEPHEVPGLLWGSLVPRPASLRRILGGRKGGRYGSLMALAGLALAAPDLRAGVLAPALYLGAALASGAWSEELSAKERLRLSLWTVAPPLFAAGAVRLAWPTSAIPLYGAAILGAIAFARALRRGLRDGGPAQSVPASGAAGT